MTEIIAFKVTDYALPLIALGFGTMFTSKREHVRQVVELKAEIIEDAEQIGRHLATRLASEEKDVAVYRFESEGVELLKRIDYFAKRIAKTMGPEAAALESAPS